MIVLIFSELHAINHIPQINLLLGQNNIFLTTVCSHQAGLVSGGSTREIVKLFLDYIWAELVPLLPFSLPLR